MLATALRRPIGHAVSRRIARTVALGICLLVAIDAAEARKLLQGGRASGRAGGRGDIKPINGPALPYTTVENPFTLPDDMKFGNVTAIAVNSKGHVFVFHRGPVPLFEFDAKGAFVRAFGEGLTNRPHGLKIDSSDNIWITDSGNHTAVKMDPTGKVLFTLGEQGKNGTWDEAAGTRLLDQPTDVAFAANGDFFVSQGHGGVPRILRFDKNGRFLKSWGVTPRSIDVATNIHSLAVDKAGLLWAGDREAGRILIFNGDGQLQRTIQMANRVSGLVLGKDGLIYISSSYEGQIIQADSDGKVLGVTGGPGNGPGEYGEAHNLTLGPANEIYAADNSGSRVHKYLPRK